MPILKSYKIETYHNLGKLRCRNISTACREKELSELARVMDEINVIETQEKIHALYPGQILKDKGII